MSILTIPSKAPYDAIAIPTPETPIAGVTTYLVNSALLKSISLTNITKLTGKKTRTQRTINERS
jgi:hypothetical protein